MIPLPFMTELLEFNFGLTGWTLWLGVPSKFKLLIWANNPELTINATKNNFIIFFILNVISLKINVLGSKQLLFTQYKEYFKK